MGVDATIGMLQIARAHDTRAPLTTGLAQSLPFSDAAFDCLSDITVVQHIPYEFQSRALQEMVRVIKPGGRMILMEVICGKDTHIGKDSHVFPREPRDWISEVERCGASLIGWFGQEFLLADRLYVRLAQTLSRTKRQSCQTSTIHFLLFLIKEIFCRTPCLLATAPHYRSFFGLVRACCGKNLSRLFSDTWHVCVSKRAVTLATFAFDRFSCLASSW